MAIEKSVVSLNTIARFLHAARLVYARNEVERATLKFLIFNQNFLFSSSRRLEWFSTVNRNLSSSLVISQYTLRERDSLLFLLGDNNVWPAQLS